MTSLYAQKFNQPVEELRAEFQRNLDNVRNRNDITPQARQVAIARAYKAARDGLARAQEDDAARYHRQRAFLERKLFGHTIDVGGNNAISSRDARDRATKYDNPNDAAFALKRAQRDGDADLARAIAAHAADHATHDTAHPGWTAVVKVYADSSPGRADAYRELTELINPDTGADLTYVLPSPSELGNLNDFRITQLADTDLTIHGNGPEAA